MSRRGEQVTEAVLEILKTQSMTTESLYCEVTKKHKISKPQFYFILKRLARQGLITRLKRKYPWSIKRVSGVLMV